MTTTETPDRKGKRYESRQDEGRIVRVLDRQDVIYGDRIVVRWLVESIANPGVPSAVGRRTKVAERTIRRQYRELSH